ncbi:MAG: serine/threonine protein kinase [Ardenticatenaceae bacterium]|nr:serine/threonine protein kinase [Ardenticatenaceae bacterium]
MTKQEQVLNGRYRLIKRIGSGGMSIVYQAQDMSLGRLVAIKMLHESLTGDEGFLRRFQREAHAAANLSHPNIVTVHDIGQDGYKHYIVMEYVDGRTLKQIIRDYKKQGQTMPISRALQLVVQICSGIGYAHRSNLVHCDVKPQNILVTRDDRVKVADFGIAQALSEATHHDQPSRVWGTPQYFSPEQAQGHPTTPASDVYAIGVVLYEMLTGELPFQADSHTALALKHIQEHPPLASELNPAVPPQLDQIINKVLAKEPAGRYRTAGQLGRILSAYRERSLADTSAMSLPLAETAVPVSELPTQIFTRPEPAHDTPARPMQPIRQTAVNQPREERETAVSVPVPASNQPDWIAIGLGITALIALLGLIPLWYYVYQAWVG